MLSLVVQAVLLTVAADPTPAAVSLDQGYSQMYDLRFSDAHQTFTQYQRLNPKDAVAPVSDAAAYLFQEFDRLSILQSEFFVHDDNFKRPKKITADPAVR